MSGRSESQSLVKPKAAREVNFLMPCGKENSYPGLPPLPSSSSSSSSLSHLHTIPSSSSSSSHGLSSLSYSSLSLRKPHTTTTTTTATPTPPPPTVVLHRSTPLVRSGHRSNTSSEVNAVLGRSRPLFNRSSTVCEVNAVVARSQIGQVTDTPRLQTCTHTALTTDRHTHTETDRHSLTDKHTHTATEKDAHTHTETDRLSPTDKHTHTATEKDRHTHRLQMHTHTTTERDRHTHTTTDKHAHTKTDRHAATHTTTDRHTHTQTERNRNIHQNRSHSATRTHTHTTTDAHQNRSHSATRTRSPTRTHSPRHTQPQTDTHTTTGPPTSLRAVGGGGQGDVPPLAPPSTSSPNKYVTVSGKRYQILHLLGQGGSSTVYAVLDEASRQVVAMKVVNLHDLDDNTLTSYQNEISMLERLKDCSRVIRLYNQQVVLGRQMVLVMELGSQDFVAILNQARAGRGAIPSFTVKHYWAGMLLAVQQIHAHGIIHCDLKPANFLLVDSTVKLIDFGIASSIQHDMTSVVKDSQVGTFNYMSPESLLDVHSGPIVNSRGGGKPAIKLRVKSDVWSLGCILYNFVYGRTPFQHISHPLQKLRAISDPNTQICFPEIKSKHLMDVLRLCLQHDPLKRPSIEELLDDHPLLTG